MNLSSRVTQLNQSKENKNMTAPWFERVIFGTIRYMTSRSMAKKFNAGAT